MQRHDTTVKDSGREGRLRFCLDTRTIDDDEARDLRQKQMHARYLEIEKQRAQESQGTLKRSADVARKMIENDARRANLSPQQLAELEQQEMIKASEKALREFGGAGAGIEGVPMRVAVNERSVRLHTEKSGQQIRDNEERQWELYEEFSLEKVSGTYTDHHEMFVSVNSGPANGDANRRLGFTGITYLQVAELIEMYQCIGSSYLGRRRGTAMPMGIVKSQNLMP
jgi:hypothetical protein